MIGTAVFIARIRSFMYKRNNNGPKTEPRGTPCSTMASVGLKVMVILRFGYCIIAR